MQTNYTLETLLSELRSQGVIVNPTPDSNLYLDGELTDAQFFAVKKFKPQIINAVNKTQVCRFAPNEYLLSDLNAAFRVFDISNNAANLFFFDLLKYTEASGEIICFCQPTFEAYRSGLNLCAALESGVFDLQTAFDDFIATHTLGAISGEWMQEKDAPLWSSQITLGEKEIAFSIGNSIQTAIFCGYHSAKNPNVRYRISKA